MAMEDADDDQQIDGGMETGGFNVLSNKVVQQTKNSKTGERN